MTQDVQTIKKDRLRYTKDSFSSTMAILAIVFDCLYFVSIYQSDVGTYYYNWLIGVSIVYNLIFLLAAFLASESVKNRRTGYSGILVVLGVIQIARIFILPMQAHAAVAQVNGVEVVVMDDKQFIYCVVCLVVSAVCCVVAAVVSARNNKILADYMKTIETKAA
ncbi:MAG: hypothetical protein E7465_02380 [Ruminococcaceae bacterium]|nr:hypothetical protein [Oscillospiraceae bacterium]